MVEERAGLLAVREMSESMHRGSAFAPSISAAAAAAGLPTTFTTLPGNGNIFNARSIPASTRNH